VTRSMTHINITVNVDTSCDIKLSERRFKTLLSLLRLGGMPINMKSVSRLRTAYNVFITFCYYYTMLCVSVDTFAHRHHLVQAMKKFRVLMGMLVPMWIHLSLGYSTKNLTVLLKIIFYCTITNLYESCLLTCGILYSIFVFTRKINKAQARKF
jgi:hypothetical protein